MGRGPISTGTATVFAVVIAAVMMTAVAAVLLPPGDGPGLSLPDTASPVEVVAGHNGTAVIRVAMGAANLTECRVYLTNPEGGLHNVETAILTDSADGQAAYIFCFPAPDRSGYWITDEPKMVFTTAYHPGVQAFSPGDWRVVVYDQTLRKNRIDRVVPVNGPSSLA